jgi:hypothetical protein
MMKSHRFYPPWYFNYLYSFYGIMAGSLAGLFLVLAIPGKPWKSWPQGLWPDCLPVSSPVHGRINCQGREPADVITPLPLLDQLAALYGFSLLTNPV